MTSFSLNCLLRDPTSKCAHLPRYFIRYPGGLKDLWMELMFQRERLAAVTRMFSPSPSSSLWSQVQLRVNFVCYIPALQAPRGLNTNHSPLAPCPSPINIPPPAALQEPSRPQRPMPCHCPLQSQSFRAVAHSPCFCVPTIHSPLSAWPHGFLSHHPP